ncbi:hypothetical protein VNO77_31563 [Canavalia gladiata]|uniref:Uncharacterized protein n=1 Tax=Canavalia gladiata TaxID=3824 RepID=A0AAN9KSS0_CANGL
MTSTLSFSRKISEKEMLDKGAHKQKLYNQTSVGKDQPLSEVTESTPIQAKDLLMVLTTQYIQHFDSNSSIISPNKTEPPCVMAYGILNGGQTSDHKLGDGK